MSELNRPRRQPLRTDLSRHRTAAQETIYQAVELLQTRYNVSSTLAYATFVQASADIHLTVRETAGRIVNESLQTSHD